MLNKDQFIAAIPNCLLKADVDGFGPRFEGKVRDCYVHGGKRILITTDRVSAFDQVVGAIPYKGVILNQLSAWWESKLVDVVKSQMVAAPDPNVTIAREAQALPVEIVVRGHITGSTSTSLWTLYDQGVARPYGLTLPAGLKKNDPLPEPVITPTTKAPAGAHDERLTGAEVVSRGLVNAELWAQVRRAALAVFRRGQELAANAGLVLVDTKYEFGLIDGELALIDEVHTPDCSRYWMRNDYEAKRGTDIEPDSWDKEYLRLWFAGQGYKGDGPPPALTNDIAAELARRYMTVAERLMGSAFIPELAPALPRIRKALEPFR